MKMGHFLHHWRSSGVKTFHVPSMAIHVDQQANSVHVHFVCRYKRIGVIGAIMVIKSMAFYE